MKPPDRNVGQPPIHSEAVVDGEAPSPGFHQVGKVKDAHGIKGELFIVLFAGEAAWLKKLKEVRLVAPVVAPAVKVGAGGGDGRLRILLVKSARLHKNGLIVKSDDLRDRNQAEELKGWLLEIPQDFLVSAPGESIYLREIQDFRVFTKHKGEVGKIVNFGSNGVQDLLVVRTNWGEFDVPLVEEFIVSVDHAEKSIHLDLPLGLLGEFDHEPDEPDEPDQAD